jgi:hypothetical protein
MGLDPQLAGGRARTAVQLVGEPVAKPEAEPPAPCDVDERRLPGLAHRDPRQRPGPLSRVPGGDHAQLQQPVVGLRSREGLDAAEDPAHVPGQDARDPALEKAPAVHLDDRLHPARAEVPGPGVQVRRPADAVLHPPVGLLDHAGVESRPGHDREVLAVHRPGVQRAAVPVQPDPDRLGEIVRHSQVRRQEIRRAGREDRQHGPRPGHGVDAALDRPVTAPDEDHLGAVGQRAAGAPGRLAALGHLVPQRVGESLPRQHLPELGQPAAEALAGVCHHRDLRHGSLRFCRPRSCRRRRRTELPEFGPR